MDGDALNKIYSFMCFVLKSVNKNLNHTIQSTRAMYFSHHIPRDILRTICIIIWQKICVWQHVPKPASKVELYETNLIHKTWRQYYIPVYVNINWYNTLISDSITHIFPYRNAQKYTMLSLHSQNLVIRLKVNITWKENRIS